MGTHGLHDFEKVRPQPFQVDLVAHLDLRKAGETGDIGHSVSYSTLVNIAREVVEGEHCELIESLAERIAARVLQHDQVTQTEVTVSKPRAPVNGIVGNAGVRITRP